MTIYTGGAMTRRGKLLEDFPAPLSDVLGATAEEAWLYSPTSSLGRLAELGEARFGEPVDWGTGEFAEQTRYSGPKSPLLSDEAAQARVEEAGVELDLNRVRVDDGIPEAALDILIERQRNAKRRQDTLNRSPSGFVPGLLKFGTALGTSMLDPLNVAASFIPVVGQARYAKLLEQAAGPLGRAGVRARVGALEGVVGQAVVEPLVYSAAQAEQADYTLADSMLNIAFGTVLGGGLHVGAGAIGDALARGLPWQRAEPDGAAAERVSAWSPQERADAMRVAVAQMAEGRPVNVQTLAEVRDALSEVRPATLSDARRQALGILAEDFRRSLMPEAEGRLSPSEVKQLEAERDTIDGRIRAAEGGLREATKRLQRTQRLSRKEAEAEARRAVDADKTELEARQRQIDERLRQHETARLAEDDLAMLQRGEVPERFRERLEQEAQRRFDFAGQKPLAAMVREAMAGGQAARVDAAWKRLRAEAAQPQLSIVADPRAAEAAQARLAEAPKDDGVEAIEAALTDEVQALRDLSETLGIDVAEDLAALDAGVRDADSLGNAARAMAQCTFRRVN